ncbi:hypothetical protein GOV10_04355, partial [Candidatus Woesearchaeota archaeon]|nr:hypothetical protein [Candidatus Woesearchaeota archaeon]
YANIGLQETIILRNRHEEAKDALWKQHEAVQQMNDELYIHNNNYFAFLDAAERAYENALPKKLANLVHEQNLTLYEGEEIIFLPDHALLVKMLKNSVDVFLGQINDIPIDSMDQKFVHEVKNYIVQAEREIWQSESLYNEEITEPYLSAMKYHLDLELVKKTGKDPSDLMRQLIHYHLIAGFRQLGLSQPVLGHTIDLQMRLRPSLREWYENKHSRLPEFMDHALWVYGLKDDTPLNKQKEEYPPPVVDMDGPLN